MPFAQTRVLIVEDSALARQALLSALRAQVNIAVVGLAADARQARDYVLRLDPDALLIDLESRNLDGPSLVELLMKRHPLPIVALGRPALGEHLRLHATAPFELVRRPAYDEQLAQLGPLLASKLALCAAAGARRQPRPLRLPAYPPDQLILIGASTGGTEAIAKLLAQLPPQLPPILIVQHIPAAFSKAFADRLDRCSSLSVKEAEDGDPALAGHGYVAPGGKHMIAAWNGRQHALRLSLEPPVWYQRPSVDILFKSISPHAAPHCIAVILTGMGKDGAAGMLELRQKGATTFGQDEASCIVYGMPKAAFDCGAVETQLPLDKIAPALLSALSRSPARLH